MPKPWSAPGYAPRSPQRRPAVRTRSCSPKASGVGVDLRAVRLGIPWSVQPNYPNFWMHARLGP
jgi:hypothetical protein